MSDQIKANIVKYKMVIFYILLFTLNSLATSIIAAFMNVEWSALTSTAKFLLIVVILQGWTGTMLAFFNKSMSRIEEGKFPIDTGDTRPPFPPPALGPK